MRAARLAVTAVLVTVMAMPALAADEVFDGTLVCAKCLLKKDDAKECQDVLLVTSASGAKVEYYIAKNDVAKAAGEVCTQEVKATVTGSVSQKDGKTWLTPSKIEKHTGQGHQGHAH